jgi:adenylate cyclase
MKTELLEPKPAPPETAHRFGLVLVVDDEQQNRTLLRDALEARGYEVAEAENGARALQMVAERPPDVILLDLMMPKMDGFEVCRRLKKDQQTAPIPILMVTALSERKERLMGIEAGANDFLNKPVDYQDVTLRVTNAIYTKHLFDRLQAEQEKSERLLLNILPAPIAQRMKQGEATIADQYPEVTVLMADLVGFTTLSLLFGPEQIVFLLNEIFSAFDRLVEKHCLEKIKTVGDAYMVAGGLPLPQPRHAEAVAELALSMREALKQWNRQYNTSICTRIGINTGPVVAGVIGRKKFAYDLWGDTVNLACQLESFGKPGAIHVAQSTYELLKHKYRFENGQVVDIKGRGEVTAYTLCGR